jgi:hypothetical protein
MKLVRKASHMLHVGGDYLDDHINIPKSLDTLSVVVQNGDSISSFLCFNVLHFAFGDVLSQKFIHELQ